MSTVKESLAALYRQRQHKIDKDDKSAENTFLCGLAMDKTTTCFQTHTMADTGLMFLRGALLVVVLTGGSRMLNMLKVM